MSFKLKITKFLFFFFICFNIFPSILQTNEDVPLDNIVLHKSPKPVDSVIFQNFIGNDLNINQYFGKVIILNFWATWCYPCKEEMPSLNKLKSNEKFKNILIFPVNMEPVTSKKKLLCKDFFKNLKIDNLEIFFDKDLNFVKKLKLRGVPTTILINKKGEEFARIVGTIDFQNEKFLNWLSNYD